MRFSSVLLLIYISISLNSCAKKAAKDARNGLTKDGSNQTSQANIVAQDLEFGTRAAAGKLPEGCYFSVDSEGFGIYGGRSMKIRSGMFFYSNGLGQSCLVSNSRGNLLGLSKFQACGSVIATIQLEKARTGGFDEAVGKVMGVYYSGLHGANELAGDYCVSGIDHVFGIKQLLPPPRNATVCRVYAENKVGHYCRLNDRSNDYADCGGQVDLVYDFSILNSNSTFSYGTQVLGSEFPPIHLGMTFDGACSGSQVAIDSQDTAGLDGKFSFSTYNFSAGRAIKNTPKDENIQASTREVSIAEMYRTYLGREASANEQKIWQDQVKISGFAAVRNGIAGSVESVNRLYFQHLGHGTDDKSFTYWRDEILRVGYDNAKFAIACSPESIGYLYTTYLHRTAEATALTFWADQMKVSSYEAVRAAISGSRESIIWLYDHYLGHGVDDASVTFWHNEIVRIGYTDAALAIASSHESINRLMLRFKGVLASEAEYLQWKARMLAIGYEKTLLEMKG